MVFSGIHKNFSNYSQFVHSMGWLGIAQVFVRVFRLGTTLILARVFTPYDYGLVAIIYAVYGFAEVFTQSSGLSASVVTADDENLEQISDTAYWISWILCVLVSIVQCILSFPIAWFYDDMGLVLPICTLCLLYFTLPLYKTSTALIQRENRLKVIALGRTIQAFVINIVTMFFALLGMGVWSVVFALILSSPVLIIVYFTNHAWRPPKRFTVEKWKEVTSFGANMLSIDIMDKIRLNFDYLIVGRFLGVNALGVYFFAFNAGLGISKQLIDAMRQALLPYLSSVNTNFLQIKPRFSHSLKVMTLIIIPLVLLQSGLAPFYVPIIFGSKWVPAIPILIIICLSAIPLTLYTAYYQLFIAMKRMRVALIWNLIFTTVFGVAILLVVNWGTLWVAVTVLICHLFNVLLGFYIYKYITSSVKSVG